MKVTVNGIEGFDEAFVAMYISKRSWTPELDKEIRETCDSVLTRRGRIKENCDKKLLKKFNKWLEMLLRMGKKHITVIRFLDISIMTEGLHRAGQDDVDAHACRFNNRIIRNSTRLAEYSDDEMSEYYKDKIITSEKVLKTVLGIDMPETIEYEGCKYVKSPNGYVKEEYKNNKDVKRGLYMLSIPSNFVSKINLCEWGHVFKERNENGSANPEVKQWSEEVMRQITEFNNQITRNYVLTIEN